MTQRKAVRRLLPLVTLAAVFGSAPLAHAGIASWATTRTTAVTDDLVGAVSRGQLKSGEAIHVVLSLKLRDEAGLDSFIGELTRPGSPAYGQSLSTQQFLASYAPSETQAQQAAAYLSRMGFINITVDASRQLVSADGTAGIVERAFNTRLESFLIDGVDAYANTRAAQIPAELSNVVLSVLGLQTVTKAHTMLQQALVADTRANASANAAVATGHNPLEFPALYKVGSTPAATNTAVGILSEGNITQSITDLRTFESQNSLPQTPVNIVQIGSAGTDTSGVGEWDLDSQDIQGMAGAALKGLTFYVIPTLSNADLTSGFSRIVSDNTLKIINVSLGECETSAKNDGSMATDDQLFKQAVAQGQTFTISTGDSGSAECGLLRKGQSYPAVSPYVVAVGGTTLNTTNGAYTSETVWNKAGGGPSNSEPKPSWQAGVGSANFRGVPDVSLDANPSSGAIIIVSGQSAQYGGTSLSAPLFAGIYARLQTAHANTLPFPNPTIYQNAPAGTLFTDVTSGNNGGYSATTGWDYASGWGSPKISGFYALFGSL